MSFITQSLQTPDNILQWKNLKFELHCQFTQIIFLDLLIFIKIKNLVKGDEN